MKLCGEAPKSCRVRKRWSNNIVFAGISRNENISTTTDIIGESELTSINDAKLLRIWAPCEIMDRAFLVQRNSAIKIPSSAEQIHPSLSVVTLVRVVDFSLGKEENLSSKDVPFDLGTIGFKERLLASRRAAKGT